MKNLKAFTLIEVMVCIVITGVVVFSVYTAMISSYKTYFKLYSISRQRNDIRYFETIFKNSVMNAESIQVTANSIACGYYDVSGMFSDGYRLDVYQFQNGVLSNDSAKSLSLIGENLSSYSANSSNVTLTIYRANADYSATSTKLRDTEIVLENINKMFYNYTDADISGLPKRHAYFTFSLIFSKVLHDGEINYESQVYRVAVENKKFKSL